MQYVIITGDWEEGFEFIGPFYGYGEACAVANRLKLYNRVVRLKPPSAID